MGLRPSWVSSTGPFSIFSPTLFWAKNTFFHLMPSPKFLKILQRIGLNHGNTHVKSFHWYIFGLGAIGKSLSLIPPIFHFFHPPFFGLKTPFFHLMPSPKFLKILQRIALNDGNAHVKLFQWYFFGFGAIGKSLSLIWPIFQK